METLRLTCHDPEVVRRSNQTEDGQRLLRDPDRLHLWRVPGATTFFIVYRQRRIGQVESVKIPVLGGFIDPPILLEKPFSEAFTDRIKDLVNKRDGTNRDIVVKTPPRRDHPAIIQYLTQSRLRW